MIKKLKRRGCRILATQFILSFFPFTYKQNGSALAGPVESSLKVPPGQIISA
jgi:hypothetical protein